MPVSGRAATTSLLETSDPGRGEASTHSTEHEGNRPQDIPTGSHKQMVGMMNLSNQPGSRQTWCTGNPPPFGFGGDATLGTNPLPRLEAKRVLGHYEFGRPIARNRPPTFFDFRHLGLQRDEPGNNPLYKFLVVRVPDLELFSWELNDGVLCPVVSPIIAMPMMCDLSLNRLLVGQVCFDLNDAGNALDMAIGPHTRVLTFV